MFDRTRAVLVTGGAGYIGSHAAWALLDAGYRVVVLDDLSTGTRGLVATTAHFVEGSAGDAGLARELIGAERIGAIMHFAGSIVVPESVRNPLKFFGNNTVCSHALIGAAAAENVAHFIFSSTAAVYGIPETLPIAETSPTAPINPYGNSKLMTEWMLRDVAAAGPMTFGVLRYFNVAGADPQGRTGQVARDATHLIKAAVQAVTGQRDRLQVFGDDYPTEDGTGVRDYIHVSDLADAHVALLEYLAGGGASITLNCGYGRGASVLQVLAAVERAAGAPVQHEFASRRPGDPPCLIADNRAILQTLPWRPRHHDLDRIVADALAWEKRLLTEGTAGRR